MLAIAACASLLAARRMHTAWPMAHAQNASPTPAYIVAYTAPEEHRVRQ